MVNFLRRKKSNDLSSSRSLLPSQRKRLSKKDDTRSLRSGVFSKRKDETSSLRSGFFHRKQKSDTHSLPSQFIATPSHKKWRDIEPQYEETPPPSPFFSDSSSPSPLHVTVVATRSSPALHPSGGHSLSGTTISDLSGSLVLRPRDEEEDVSLPQLRPVTPYSEASRTANTRAITPYSEGGTLEETTVVDASTQSVICSQDTASDIVKNLFGLVGSGCKGTEEEKVPKFQGDEWGTAPSESMDEGPVAKTPPAKNKTAEPAAAAVPMERSPSDHHENYELVLDEDEGSLKKRSWRRRSAKSMTPRRSGKTVDTVPMKEFTIETKEEYSVTSEMDQEERYKAVFGEDPDNGNNKKKKSGVVMNSSKRLPPKKTPPPKEQKPVSKAETEKISKSVKNNADEEKGNYLQLTIDNLNEEELLGEILVDDEEEVKQRFSFLSRGSSKSRQIKQEDTLAKINEEVEKALSDAGAPELKSSRSRSWGLSGRPPDPVKLERSLSDDKKAKSISRTLSHPLKKISASFKKGPPIEPVKPDWRAVEDPNSGQTYYYHRVSRKTSWSKPQSYDKQVREYQKAMQAKKEAEGLQQPTSMKKSRFARSADLSGARQKQLDDGLPPRVSRKRSLSSVLRKKSSRDFNRDVWATKQEIARLLKVVGPNDVKKVEGLMRKHEGNEEALLESLRALAESQPFDEPLAVEDEKNDNSTEGVQRTATALSGASGMSSRVRSGRTALTHLTDTTQKVKNTKRVDSGFAAIPEAVTQQSPSVDTDLSNSQPQPTRERELRVEEFPSSRDDRKRAEVFDSKAPLRQLDRVPKSNQDDLNSFNGNETDDYGTDSVSELGHSDTEFQRQKKRYDLARRMALDDAIRNKDWELAASMTENIRGRSFDSKESAVSYIEWTQSELDRFISENDWSAVAAYIAHMRDIEKGDDGGLRGYDIPHMHDRSPSKKAAVGRSDNAEAERDAAPSAEPAPVLQKRFGAKSQLQHPNDSELVSIASSWESVYRTDSSDDSSVYTSSESSFDLSLRQSRRMAT